MLIGILHAGRLDQDLEKKHGTMSAMFVQLFEETFFDFRVYEVSQGAFPESIQECDAWLISGSAYGVYDNIPFIEELGNFIRKAFDFSVPLIGICFGHQIIAHVLGGQVEKFEGGWCAGPEAYEFGEDTITLNAMHQDQVVRPPYGAETIASSPGCKIAGLKYGSRALTYQPHPEFTKDFMIDLISADKRLPSTVAKKAKASLTDATDENFIVRAVVDFLKPVEDSSTRS